MHYASSSPPAIQTMSPHFYSSSPSLAMLTPPNLCAFCTSAAIPTSGALLFRTSHISFRPYRTFAPPTRPRNITFPQKKKRRPVATFKPNRNDENISSQFTDLLLSIGRFLQSPTGQVVLWAGLAWLVITGRIGILFDSFLVIFGLLTIVPVLAVVCFRWWLNRQLVQGVCPSCGAEVTGLRNQPFQCTTCGNTVMGEKGDFSVKDPSSATIDIEAKEVDDI